MGTGEFIPGFETIDFQVTSEASNLTVESMLTLAIQKSNQIWNSNQIIVSWKQVSHPTYGQDHKIPQII